jgi:hypothetical protein
MGRENNTGALPRIISSIETPAFQCGTCSKHFRAGTTTLHNLSTSLLHSFLFSPLVNHSYVSHLSIPSLHQMVTTNDANNCTHPSLPPFQSPTTDPSSPSADNEEVIVLGVVSPPAEATSLAVDVAVNDSTHAASKMDTEISNVIAFFNPISKKPRCNMLRDCYNITPMVSRGFTIACKRCHNFGVSNCFLLLS